MITALILGVLILTTVWGAWYLNNDKGDEHKQNLVFVVTVICGCLSLTAIAPRPVIVVVVIVMLVMWYREDK